MKLSIAIMVGSRRERGQRALDTAAASAAGCPAEILILELTAGQPPLRLPDHLPATVLQLAGTTVGEARAAAARAARGTLVAYLEDHCYPEPGWAAALCARADEGWSAVGYGFRNANPRSSASRAMALMEYGHWVVPTRQAAHPASMLAGNNIAYARAALLGLNSSADELLDTDWVLQRVLSASGQRMLFEPGAIAVHEHFDRLLDGFQILAMYGTLATQRRARSERWTRGRRLLHVALALPATPPLRIMRLLRARPDLAARVARSLPLMLPPLLASAWGEMRGAARPNDPRPAQRFATLEMELLRTGS